MPPKLWLKSLLQGRGTPVLNLIDQQVDGHGEEFLSAANLWNLAFSRAKELRQEGFAPGCVLVSEMASLPNIIDFLAAMALGNSVWVVKNFDGWTTSTAQDEKTYRRVGSAGVFAITTPDIPDFISEDSSGLILSTSGTSKGRGQPVFLDWEKVIRQVELHANFWSEFDEDVRLSILPKFHCFGLILDFLVGLRQRQTIALSFGAATRAKHLLRWVIDHEARIVAMTPRQLWLLQEQMKATGLERLDLTVHCGGAPLEPKFADECRAVGIRVVDGYGLTEAGPGVLMDGLPLGCDVKIDRLQKDSPVNDSNLGELLVRSQTIGDFAGKTLDGEGFLRSGDLAVFKNGRYQILGRSRDKIKKVDGTWVSYQTVEDDLKLRFSLARVFVRGDGPSGLAIEGFADAAWKETSKLSTYFAKRYGVHATVNIIALEVSLYSRVIEQPGKDLRSSLTLSLNPSANSMRIAG